ncbi:MAG: thiamine pyrophosphate-dependent dehydrogenase E1 component subunit alpha [Solirubrobacteraceae bacterium]
MSSVDGLRTLRKLLVIRRFEERLIRLFDDGDMVGHFHVCTGQEGTALGVLAHARPDDVIFTTHRSHGHLLARGADPETLFAEILGRATGCCGGRAGTLHLSMPEIGVPWTSGMVGGNLPQAVGSAYALRRLRPGAIAVCFFGDGSLEEGAVLESFNSAAVLGVPLLMICENNGLAADHGVAGTFPTSSTAAERLSDIPGALQIPSVTIDGIDPWAVSRVIEPLVEEIRAGGGPRFVEAATVRWPGSRPAWPKQIGGPFDVGWITGEIDAPDVIAEWTRVGDPLHFAYDGLIGDLTPDDLRAMDIEVQAEIDAAAHRAMAAALPDPENEMEAVR